MRCHGFWRSPLPLPPPSDRTPTAPRALLWTVGSMEELGVFGNHDDAQALHQVAAAVVAEAHGQGVPVLVQAVSAESPMSMAACAAATTVGAAVHELGSDAAALLAWLAAADGTGAVGLCFGSVDHAALLPHVSGVLHHGGSGTTAACACTSAPPTPSHGSAAGVPVADSGCVGVAQGFLPFMFDQPHWAACMRAAGVSAGAVEWVEVSCLCAAGGGRG